LTVLIASVVAPIAGAAIDSSLKGTSLFSSLPSRELVNFTAALPAIAVLVFLCRKSRRLDSVATLAWISGVSVLVLVGVRFVLQLATNIIDLSANPQWIGPEFLIAIMLWPILWGVMGLVVQRGQLFDTQEVLLDEARRALQDDHEALRNRVFDHLHGTVTSELVVARVRLNEAAAESTDPQTAQKVREVAEHIRRIHELEVRRLAHVIVAAGLETSLDEALWQLAESCEGLCEVRVNIAKSYATLENRLSENALASLRLTIYRLIEECLNNALRHAQASHVEIEVTTSGSAAHPEIHVMVTNDGNVNAETPASGVGLRVMRARVGVYDGLVSAQSDEGRFTVNASLRLTT